MSLFVLHIGTCFQSNIKLEFKHIFIVFCSTTTTVKQLKQVILYYVEHDLRAKGKFYAPNLAPFLEAL